MTDFTIYDLLKEEEDGSDRQDTPQKGGPCASPDPGGHKIWKKFMILGSQAGLTGVVSGAQARAEEEPLDLLRDLGVTRPSGDSPLALAVSVLRQAMRGGSAFAEAFPDGVEHPECRAFEITNVHGIHHPDKYVMAVLQAALNAGFLDDRVSPAYKSRGSSKTLETYDRDVVRLSNGNVLVRNLHTERELKKKQNKASSNNKRKSGGKGASTGSQASSPKS